MGVGSDFNRLKSVFGHVHLYLLDMYNSFNSCQKRPPSGPSSKLYTLFKNILICTENMIFFVNKYVLPWTKSIFFQKKISSLISRLCMCTKKKICFFSDSLSLRGIKTIRSQIQDVQKRPLL